MSAKGFIERQITQIRRGGRAVLLRKLKMALQMATQKPVGWASFIFAIPAVVVIRLVRPWLLVRMGGLISERIGHFAANTELYLCERDAGVNVPKCRYVDLFFFIGTVCNQQLAIMWKRVLRVWPAWFLAPIARVNRLIPGGSIHDALADHTALDINGFLDRYPSHLQFTAEEEARGKANLRAMGIPSGTPFVCLIVRDDAYLDTHYPLDNYYHNYRDSDIQNCVLAAEELAGRGYFVIRMGAKVREAMKSTHPMVIDYATNGMRGDFMDIYLGAKCALCISTGTGWDAIPEMLRRPIVYINFVPLGYLHTFRREFLSITKRHVLQESQKTLTLREIVSHGVGFCLDTRDYDSKGVQLIENTPEEIRDAAVEMIERLNGGWQAREDDAALQRRFWEIFPKEAVDAYQGRPLHGEIRARFGAAYLRDNRAWLQ